MEGFHGRDLEKRRRRNHIVGSEQEEEGKPQSERQTDEGSMNNEIT